MRRMIELEPKVENLDLAVREHMQLVENRLKEQERTTVSQCKQIEQNVRKSHEERKSYSKILKGICDKVCKLLEKVATLPADMAKKEMQSTIARTAHDVSEAFDDFLDREKRKLTMVVHNLGESQGDTFQERTADILRISSI